VRERRGERVRERRGGVCVSGAGSVCARGVDAQRTRSCFRFRAPPRTSTSSRAVPHSAASQFTEESAGVGITPLPGNTFRSCPAGATGENVGSPDSCVGRRTSREVGAESSEAEAEEEVEAEEGPRLLQTDNVRKSRRRRRSWGCGKPCEPPGRAGFSKSVWVTPRAPGRAELSEPPVGDLVGGDEVAVHRGESVGGVTDVISTARTVQ